MLIRSGVKPGARCGSCKGAKSDVHTNYRRQA